MSSAYVSSDDRLKKRPGADYSPQREAAGLIPPYEVFYSTHTRPHFLNAALPVRRREVYAALLVAG